MESVVLLGLMGVGYLINKDKDDKHKVYNNVNPPINVNSGNSVYDLVEDLISDIDDLVLGDVNQDGVLNVVDIVQVVNMVLGTVAVNDAADINSDNLVNIVDIVSLVNLILNTQE